MSWRAPTETDLLEAISSDELAGLRSASLAQGQGDPVPANLAAATEEARGYIAANRDNTLGPAGTLPPRLIRAVVDITLLRIGSRLVGIIFDPDNVRRTAANEARRLLERVADGRFAIEKPDTPADTAEQNTAIGPRIRDRKRLFTDQTQDGI